MISRVEVSLAGSGAMLQGWLEYRVDRSGEAVARQMQLLGVEL